jgi:peptidoglycan/LPS O-acetylase OafA/YrhL
MTRTIMSKSTRNLEYRKEIDGLRAIALIPVILFHAGLQSFSGGFVGVDIFFVISGYLITSIILAEQQSGTFSLLNFYERRARRILPPLFIIMIICLPFAWIYFLPSDMREFTESLASVSLYSGYFETAAELKPLLHTWSLAVEEQFYLLFPIFISLTWKLGKRWIFCLLILFCMLSFTLAIWGSTNKPSATFFLLPTRGWEILIGCLIAFYLSSSTKLLKNNTTLNQSASFIGLSLIIYSFFAFDKNIPFPSIYTLVPTFGAALIIIFSNQYTLVGRIKYWSA